jgi:hypothetical protein
MLHTDLKSYLDAVVNPFGADKPVQIPDAQSQNSICLRDAGEYSGFKNESTETIQGALIWLDYLHNPIRNANADLPYLIYSLNVAYFDENGSLSASVFSFTGNNTVAILGTDGTSQISYDTSIVSGLRMISMGLKILPVIEQVTDSSQLYVSYYIGGQITPADIEYAIVNGSDIRTIVKSSYCSEVFGNNSGITVRFDPFQKEQLITMLSLSQLKDSSAFNSGDIRFPCVAVQFSQAVTADTLFPIIIHTQFWMEAIMRQPTPFYSGLPPVDPNFDHAFSTMATSSDKLFPLVTKGHTFTSFYRKVGLFINLARNLHKLGSQFVNPSNRQKQNNNKNKNKNKNKNNKNNKNNKIRRARRRNNGNNGRALGGKPLGNYRRINVPNSR